MRLDTLRRNRSAKIVLLLAPVLVLGLMLRERASWRPRTLPHISPATALTFLPDGALLSTHDDGTLTLWRNGAQQSSHTLSGYRRGDILKFSPTGEVLAGCRADSYIQLWDSYTGKPLSFPRRKPLVPKWALIIFASDAKKIVIADSSTELWNRETGVSRQIFPNSAIQVFSPDSKTLAGTSYNTIELLDVQTGKPRQTLKPARPIGSLTFSPDGEILAGSSASYGGNKPVEVMLWDVRPGEVRFKRSLLADSYSGFMLLPTFSSDSRMLASFNKASNGFSSIQLWDVTSGQLLRALPARGQDTTGIAFSPDGSTLATTDQAGALTLWRIK